MPFSTARFQVNVSVRSSHSLSGVHLVTALPIEDHLYGVQYGDYGDSYCCLTAIFIKSMIVALRSSGDPRIDLGCPISSDSRFCALERGRDTSAALGGLNERIELDEPCHVIIITHFLHGLFSCNPQTTLKYGVRSNNNHHKTAPNASFDLAPTPFHNKPFSGFPQVVPLHTIADSQQNVLVCRSQRHTYGHNHIYNSGDHPSFLCAYFSC